MTKIAYNNQYNKTQILLRDSVFKREMRKTKKNFYDLGCPLPKGGLKSEEEFIKWKEKYFHLREKKKQFTNFYQNYFQDILIANGIKPFDKYYNKFLENYLFFNKTEPEIKPLRVVVKYSNDKKEKELYIQIFPNTTKKDISNIWSLIEKEKKEIFKKEDIKSKKWECMNRDIEIYKRSEQLAKIPFKKRKEKYGAGAIYQIIKDEMHDKGKLTPEIIRASIFKVKKNTKTL